jgi:hypothetical protein
VKGICSTMLDLHNDNCDICVTVVDYAALINIFILNTN